MFIKSEMDCFHLERSFNDLSLCVSSFGSHIFYCTPVLVLENVSLQEMATLMTEMGNS